MDPIKSDGSPKWSPKKLTDLSSMQLSRLMKDRNIVDSKTLILDDNNLADIEQLDQFQCLEKLSIRNNKLSSMLGIEKAVNLKVVDLGNNNIANIEGLQVLKQLTWLNLSGNNIQHAGGLSENTQLCHLDLSDNCLSSIEDITPLMELRTLLLHGDMFNSLKDISVHVPVSVTILSLSENEFADLTEFQLLHRLSNLEQVSCIFYV